MLSALRRPQACASALRRPAASDLLRRLGAAPVRTVKMAIAAPPTGFSEVIFIETGCACHPPREKGTDSGLEIILLDALCALRAVLQAERTSMDRT